MSKAAWTGLILLGGGLGLTMFFLTAGIPEQEHNALKLFEQQLSRVETQHQSQQKTFESIIESEKAFLSSLPEVSALRNQAKSIGTEIQNVRKGQFDAASQLAKENNRRKRFDMRAFVATGSAKLDTVQTAQRMKSVIAQAERLKSYKTDNAGLISRARKAVAAIPNDGVGAALEGKANELKATFPGAASKIDKKLNTFRELGKVHADLATLNGLAEKKPINFLETGRLADRIISVSKEYTARRAELTQDLDSLSVSIDKILIDMMRDGGKPNHKYRIITDQKSVDTDWKQVPEAFYRLHENNLGLTLVSKPAGVFEEDASKVAAPPGYNYVGNSRYGEWKYRNGSSYWAFYGRYRFMQDLFWGPRYYSPIYRSDWNGYRRSVRRGRPYYGSAKQYGTTGSRTKTRYSKSNYMKRAKTRGYRRSSYSGSGSRRSGYSGSRYRGSSYGGFGK